MSTDPYDREPTDEEIANAGLFVNPALNVRRVIVVPHDSLCCTTKACRGKHQDGPCDWKCNCRIGHAVMSAIENCAREAERVLSMTIPQLIAGGLTTEAESRTGGRTYADIVGKAIRSLV